MKLDIQLFSDGKVVIDTEIDNSGIKKGLKDTENNVNKAGSTVKSIIAGLGITKIISTAMNAINSSIDGAVKRVDTLNNFPKVMENLGISGQEASKSINTLSSKLVGLPTTLNDAASAVQRLTSANGDINKSTDIFLAMNNAILAGGASMDTQSTAMEQLSQAYAKGKPDAMEWRSILTAMPAQLKQMATELGYTSTAVGGDFYEAIQSGNLSMDDFMNTMIKLNNEGTSGFASFEKQAKSSTGGINTSIANMKTSITRGVADMINQIDNGLEKYGGLSEVINKIGELFEKALKKIGSYLPTIIDYMVKFANIMIKISPYIAPIVSGLVAMGAAFKVMSIVKTVTSAISLFNAVLLANPIVLIIGGITALVTALILLWKKCDAFRNFWIGLWEGIKNIVSKVIDFIKENWLTILIFLINPFAGIVKIIYDNFDKIKEIISSAISKIGEWFSSLPSKIGNAIGLIIGHIIKLGAEIGSWIINELPKLINDIVKWFETLPSRIWNALIGISLKLALIIYDLINVAKRELPKFISSFVSFMNELPNKMLNIGINIVKGIWNGIKNAEKWLLDKIKDFAKGITDGIKKVLGIHSPSRVMRDEVGKFLAQGIGIGFDEELNDVYNKMQKAINFEQSKLQANVETGRVFNTLSNSTPIQININGDVEMDSQKVGRLVTPTVSKTMKSGGAF